ncbi:MAG: AAA family ATPase [Lachnospiraceae bacterium]|nr:AAA family ATPase [Lachnospiraceae bacterium]
MGRSEFIYASATIWKWKKSYGQYVTVFFEIGTDTTIFDGLEITGDTVLCDAHMGRYPVICISFKDAWGMTYEDARLQMWAAISREAGRHAYLQSSKHLDDIEKEALYKLRTGKGNLESSFMVLSDLLFHHYGRKVIILIDEYDVCGCYRLFADFKGKHFYGF